MMETKTLLQRLSTFGKAITVEPVALLMLTGTILASTASQTLILDKVCRVNFNLTDEICDAIRNQETDNNDENERIVQEYVAPLLAYKSIITSVLPFILLMFAGGWMDLTGRRKIMILLPIIADNLVQANNILNVVFFYQLRVEFLIFTDAVLSSICGGWALLYMSLFSYITDITTVENRTYRLGLVSFCVFIAMPIGVSLGGYLLKIFGYLTVYITSMVCVVTNLIYVTFLLRDPERTTEHKLHDGRGFKYILKSFFTPVHIVNSMKVLFKKTETNRCVLLCILLTAVCFLFGPYYGDMSIMYMSTRYRFSWDELQYAIFQTYNMCLNIIGIMFSIIVISKILGWHDAVLGLISTTSKIMSSFVYCFAATGGVFYLGPLVDILNGTSFVAIRSIISKSVESHEIAKMTSIVCMTEVLLPFLYVPLYTQIYTATMGTMPGAVFLLGALLTVPPLIIFAWLFYRHISQTKRDKLSNNIE